MKEQEYNQILEERINKILDHIQNVQRNCYKLGLALIKEGEVESGRTLMTNGQIHDNSKLKGIEFDHLISGSNLLKETIKHHQQTNPHHPEYWQDGIHGMPDVYLAEMVCDCAARASEFGTSVREWFQKEHPKRYKYNLPDKPNFKIQRYLNMLLDNKF